MTTVSEAFKFCPVCGGKFKTNSDIEKECTNCGYIYYISANPSAGGLIVNEKGEVLLIKRKRNPHKGTLDIPAGFCDGVETFEEALVREMKEEIGLDVTNFEYFKSYIGDYGYKGVVKRYLVAVFLIRIDSKIDKIEAGDDAESLKFYSLDEIDYSPIAFESTKNILINYKDSIHENR